MVKIFGQHCVILTPSEGRSTAYKFRPKGRSGVFIGSDPQRKGYFVYVSGQGNRVIHSRSVIFLEPPTSEVIASDLHPQEDPMRVVTNESEDETNNSIASDDCALPTPSARGLKEIPRHHDAQQSQIGLALSPSRVAALNGTDALTRSWRSERIANRSLGLVLSAANVTLREVINEPLNLNEAKASKEWVRWEKAIREEIEALHDNDTFEVVAAPPGA
ncbi:hypothetical protein PC116_g23557 [Phytophthora cactorum]|uniref:Retroviral polymerase SH3-like domain-containing protein n=1 Tax=Phytophthora cactorum TaxID=29920 RepID=A0A329RKU0_9STRA|nr:hypothetical protein PC117_g21167 [Phytophthora cactorum]KAG2912486.1 hypothetical protein PC114_g8904 [Phytophthora cactorum]KAG3001120.1 hypothetical protein PC120_g20475 [Phytophthora cactorum]KAG3024294.1 hypothetical protein PC119_g8552 [Phytophthora cactorum]KAG3139561.1 hypothetical protein C6341_g20316 [Phytophthora cactorum]